MKKYISKEDRNKRLCIHCKHVVPAYKDDIVYYKCNRRKHINPVDGTFITVLCEEERKDNPQQETCGYGGKFYSNNYHLVGTEEEAKKKNKYEEISNNWVDMAINIVAQEKSDECKTTCELLEAAIKIVKKFDVKNKKDFPNVEDCFDLL